MTNQMAQELKDKGFGISISGSIIKVSLKNRQLGTLEVETALWELGYETSQTMVGRMGRSVAVIIC